MRTTVTVKPGPISCPDFNRGDLVISDTGRIVLVTGDGKDAGTFAGVSLVDHVKVMDNSASWVKHAFVPFIGKITLEGK